MRQYSVEESIEISNKITRFTIVLVVAIVAFVIGVILVKLLWGWSIPDLFPAAVDQGLINSELTWLAAAKVVILVAILTSTGSLVSGRWSRRLKLPF